MNNNTITELLSAQTRHAQLKREIIKAYSEDIDKHNTLVKERKELENKFKLEATINKTQKVRMETSCGATDWEERKITFNVSYNPLTSYGCFEIYSDCGEYYGEGGLWFNENELVDYDGVFELSNEIKIQLDKWGLDTSYLD